MNGQHDQVEALLNRALEFKLSERAAFLSKACGNDQELRQKVETLLHTAEDAEGFMEGVTTIEVTPLSEGPGTTVGRYKLLQKVGEGGMGVVYMAEQTEPVTRKVALKIIKLGMDTKQVVARFEAERQALAMMDHPNIARVLDAGATDTGRPYFVMELVRGVPITEYCDKNKLSTQDRLNLFIPVCQAIQHAHQKGVIHRDIKPSNVMVTLHDGNAVPKVIDFGIAKATNQKLTEKTLFTNYSQMIGTPAYMSPEQAEMSGLDVDTRTDVYSLGVLLYELLTGTTPFPSKELLSMGYGEMQKIIAEKEPPKPSTRLSTMQNEERTVVARNRSMEVSALGRVFKGDLDWIVMKALEKDRTLRYETVNGLVADIELHLKDRPITARRPSAIGRARRFVRRNKAPVALTALALLACGAALSLAIIARIEHLKQHEQSLLIERAKARDERMNWARQTAMPAVKQLVEDGHLVRAFRLAREVQKVLPDDPAFHDLWDSFIVTVSFDLKPPGTRVFVRDWDGKDDDWMEVGETPLTNVTLPNGGLRFRYTKKGYITREFDRPFPDFLGWDGPVSMKKDPGIPEDMVFVDGVQASVWNHLPADLGDFLIDRYEVSNREFQDFVDAGGYEKPEYWKGLQFTRDGRALSWTEAMARFRDATGQAGPAGWRNGRFPERADDYPVQGISWFEAAAYARFVGKSLPTVYHWQWAADGNPGHMVALSNFSNKGPTPRGAQKGIGHFDVYDLAGNVKEWCWNLDEQGRRCLRGGAWNDARYLFLSVDVASPWDRGETHGFRCVRYLQKGGPAATTLDPWHRELPHLVASKRLPVESLKSSYQYDDAGKKPLKPVTIQVGDQGSDSMRHQIVRINAAYDDRFDVHLYLPRESGRKLETILFVPGAGACLSRKYSIDRIIEGELIRPLVRSGRAVCMPVCKGMFERGDGTFSIPAGTVQSRNLVLDAAKDVARTADYLATRDDLDPHKLVFMGYSLGSTIGIPLLVFHRGFDAAILISAGYLPKEPTEAQKIIDPFNFVPHVTLPTLYITGGMDTLMPYQSVQLPFFEDLGSTNKKHVVLESGHNPPTDAIIKAVDEWLQAQFGPP